jgi:hypothetical protein
MKYAAVVLALLCSAPAWADAPVPTAQMTQAYIDKLDEFVRRGFTLEQIIVGLQGWYGQEFITVRDGQGHVDIVNVVWRKGDIIYYNTIGTLPAAD